MSLRIRSRTPGGSLAATLLLALFPFTSAQMQACGPCLCGYASSASSNASRCTNQIIKNTSYGAICFNEGVINNTLPSNISFLCITGDSIVNNIAANYPSLLQLVTIENLICSPPLVIFGLLCLISCPSGFFNNNKNICQPCGNNCSTCLNSTYCSTCPTGFQAKLGKCSACPGLKCAIALINTADINVNALVIGLCLGCLTLAIFVIYCRIKNKRKKYEIKANLRQELLYSGVGPAIQMGPMWMISSSEVKPVELLGSGSWGDVMQ